MKETEYKEPSINDWMKDVVFNSALPDGEGIIKTIQPPVKITTKFGERYTCSVVIEGKDNSTINVKLFLPEQFPMVHPKSNMGKIMKKYDCKEFIELIGKTVQVEEHGEGMWKIVA